MSVLPVTCSYQNSNNDPACGFCNEYKSQRIVMISLTSTQMQHLLFSVNVNDVKKLGKVNNGIRSPEERNTEIGTIWLLLASWFKARTSGEW